MVQAWITLTCEWGSGSIPITQWHGGLELVKDVICSGIIFGELDVCNVKPSRYPLDLSRCSLVHFAAWRLCITSEFIKKYCHFVWHVLEAVYTFSVLGSGKSGVSWVHHFWWSFRSSSHGLVKSSLGSLGGWSTTVPTYIICKYWHMNLYIYIYIFTHSYFHVPFLKLPKCEVDYPEIVSVK